MCTCFDDSHRGNQDCEPIEHSNPNTHKPPCRAAPRRATCTVVKTKRLQKNRRSCARFFWHHCHLPVTCLSCCIALHHQGLSVHQVLKHAITWFLITWCFSHGHSHDLHAYTSLFIDREQCLHTEPWTSFTLHRSFCRQSFHTRAGYCPLYPALHSLS